MRRTIALVFALVGTILIRIAVWFDAEVIRDTLLAVVKILEPPAKKADPNDLDSRYGNVERYVIEDFEEPH